MKKALLIVILTISTINCETNGTDVENEKADVQEKANNEPIETEDAVKTFQENNVTDAAQAITNTIKPKPQNTELNSPELSNQTKLNVANIANVSKIENNPDTSKIEFRSGVDGKRPGFYWIKEAVVKYGDFETTISVQELEARKKKLYVEHGLKIIKERENDTVVPDTDVEELNTKKRQQFYFPHW